MKAFVSGLALCCACMSSLAADWSQYRGPDRDGRSAETGLLRSWPESGPKELWRVPVGDGFSAISVVGDKLYTMDADETSEYALCADAKTGKTLWRTKLDSLFTNSFGDGPRSTPTVEGDRVYVLASNGTAAALNRADGALIWSKDIKEFGAEVPNWAFCAAPLIVGDQMIMETGGTQGRNIVSFNKHDGSINWTSVEGTQAYSSPILATLAGKQQLVVMYTENVVGLDLQGKQLWAVPFAPQGTIKPAPPVVIEGDRVFVSASYGIGAMLIQVQQTEAGLSASAVWDGKDMHNHFNGSVAQGVTLYGFDKENLRCINAVDRTKHWVKRGLGKGSLIMADGLLFVLGERGRLVLVEAGSEAYNERGSVQVLSGRCWTQPSLLDGVLYVRNGDEMVALAVK